MLQKQEQVRHPCGLSERELQVLALWSECLSIEEIASRLGISSYSVANHFTRIKLRLGARDDIALRRHPALSYARQRVL